MTEALSVDPGAQSANQKSPQEIALEAVAESLGWKPDGKFQGDPALFQPASKWLETNVGAFPHLRKQLAEARQAVDSLQKQSQQTQETMAMVVTKVRDDANRKLAESIAQLEDAYAQAVASGDKDGIKTLGKELRKAEAKIEDASQQATTGNAQPRQQQEVVLSPEMQEMVDGFMERNPWYKKDRRETRMADAIGQDLIEQGYTGKQFIRKLEEALHEERPHLYKDSGSSPGRFEGATRSGREQKLRYTESDVPEEIKRHFIGADRKWRNVGEYLKHMNSVED
jgi:flagellar biosynthesis GTPase FlhF